MKFKKISNQAPAVEYLVKVIDEKLARRQKVLWLVPGGSAIKIAVEAVERLESPLDGLTVSLTDERYGPTGHADSNWPQLLAAGFTAPGARLLPVLDGSSRAETVNKYEAMLLSEIKRADYSMALVGMGPDGHIFGIKPGSPSVGDKEYVVGYEWDDYDRVTPTIKLIKLLDEVVIYATGEEKWPQFKRLERDISPDKQPAQILKRLKKVIIFNDYKEGKS